MCPKQIIIGSLPKQQGFLLPLALFILVVMSLFAVVLSRNTIQTSNSSTLEMISVQAFYAAESGGQRGMAVLFYPNASVRQAVDTRCNAMNATYTFAAIVGLKNCSVVVTCACLYQDGSICAPLTAANYDASSSANKISFYKISSVATCGNGNLRSVRTIEAGSFLEQE